MWSLDTADPEYCSFDRTLRMERFQIGLMLESLDE